MEEKDKKNIVKILIPSLLIPLIPDWTKNSKNYLHLESHNIEPDYKQESQINYIVVNLSGGTAVAYTTTAEIIESINQTIRLE